MEIAPQPKDNLIEAMRALARSGERGADLCILPELFTNRYVGQFPDTKALRGQLPNHEELLADFQEASKRTRTPVLVPFAEVVDEQTCYNSLVLIDKSGRLSAKYRKTHIPDSKGYREDLYFQSGDLGYVVARLGSVKVGLGICWDQWFPEASRALALQGADLIVYPSAIGSEIIRPAFDSRPEWELVMRAQAIMNRVFVAAVNRVGQEEHIRFYGGSFVADPWGKVVKRASTSRPEIVFADLDLSQIREARSFFGFLDTRRPETYGALTRAPRAKPKNKGGAT
jgi:N-carbamoylputrescine amidase